MLLKDERKKYMKQVRALLPVYGAPERRFLKGLENSLEEYLLEHPAAVLSDFEDRFGAPHDVVREYVSKPSCHTFGTTINETMQAIGY